jgi:hypothetical protein
MKWFSCPNFSENPFSRFFQMKTVHLRNCFGAMGVNEKSGFIYILDILFFFLFTRSYFKNIYFATKSTHLI